MHLRVPLVCSVRCSATGKPLCDAGLLVTADGRPARVIRRPDGYVVFTDLAPGEHRLRFFYPNYREAGCTVFTREEGCELEVITLRPVLAAGEGLCRLTVTGLKAGETAWLSGQILDLRLQQKDCPAGTREVRLYQKAGGKPIPPLRVLCADRDAPEVGILVDRLGEELWQMARPLRFSHKRGVSFYLTQPYEVSEEGTVQAVFFCAGPVAMLYGESLHEYTVKEGDQIWQIQL